MGMSFKVNTGAEILTLESPEGTTVKELQEGNFSPQTRVNGAPPSRAQVDQIVSALSAQGAAIRLNSERIVNSDVVIRSGDMLTIARERYGG